MNTISVFVLAAAAASCTNAASIAPAAPGTGGLPYYEDRDFTPRWAQVQHAIGDFELTSQSGATVTRNDLAGRIHVASFLFTTCPSICPTLVQQLKRIDVATRDVPDLRIVSYSVTPESDTPARLAQFGRERGIDPARWMLLTGSARTIASLARDSYFADDSRLDTSGTESAGQVLHTEKLLLVDGEGHLRGVYNGTIPFDVTRLIGDIRALDDSMFLPD
jgi:protein SCO1/2